MNDRASAAGNTTDGRCNLVQRAWMARPRLHGRSGSCNRRCRLRMAVVANKTRRYFVQATTVRHAVTRTAGSRNRHAVQRVEHHCVLARRISGRGRQRRAEILIDGIAPDKDSYREQSGIPSGSTARPELSRNRLICSDFTETARRSGRPLPGRQGVSTSTRASSPTCWFGLSGWRGSAPAHRHRHDGLSSVNVAIERPRNTRTLVFAGHDPGGPCSTSGVTKQPLRGPEGQKRAAMFMGESSPADSAVRSRHGD